MGTGGRMVSRSKICMIVINKSLISGPGYVTPPICISLIAKYLGTTAINGMVKRELDV